MRIRRVAVKITTSWFGYHEFKQMIDCTAAFQQQPNDMTRDYSVRVATDRISPSSKNVTDKKHKHTGVHRNGLM